MANTLETIVGELLNSAAAELITNIVIALIILFIGFAFGKFLNKLITKVLKDLELDKGIQKITKNENIKKI